jgi:putative ABC transport system substrate-binding protein
MGGDSSRFQPPRHLVAALREIHRLPYHFPCPRHLGGRVYGKSGGRSSGRDDDRERGAHRRAASAVGGQSRGRLPACREIHRAARQAKGHQPQLQRQLAINRRGVHNFGVQCLVASKGAPRTAGELQRATRSVPIVLVNVADPVGAGFVESLARPGGNITGFLNYEYGLASKWLELLKQIAPGVTRVAVMRDPCISAGTGQFGAIQSAAPSFGVELTPVNVRDAGEIERAVAAFARSSNGGLIVTGSALTTFHRDLIVSLAARHRLPAVYPRRLFVVSGGLISYGADLVEPHRRAAGYVDRILKGEKPADLPVQAPTKYELAINLKTAKALGLDVPATVLARADEVLE